MTGIAVTALAGLGAGVGHWASVIMAGGRPASDSPVPGNWPAAKADRMRAEDQLRRAAAGRPLLPPQPARARGTPVPPERAALTEGIVPLAGGGPFRPSRFTGTNLWNGRVGDRWEVVQAGGVPAASAGLFVYTRSPDPASSDAPRVVGVRVPSPARRGLFTVRAVSGRMLTLSLSGSRTPYYFNVVTLRFTR